MTIEKSTLRLQRLSMLESSPSTQNGIKILQSIIQRLKKVKLPFQPSNSTCGTIRISPGRSRIDTRFF